MARLVKLDVGRVDEPTADPVPQFVNADNVSLVEEWDDGHCRVLLAGGEQLYVHGDLRHLVSTLTGNHPEDNE